MNDISNRAARKLDHAEFFLYQLRAETRKVVGKNPVAIEAYLSACLGAIQSALYRLEKSAGKPAYDVRVAEFKGNLRKGPLGHRERKRFDRMQELRHQDVHVSDIEYRVRESQIPYYRFPGITTSFAAPQILMLNQGEGTWIGVQTIEVDGFEAADLCEKYVDLLRRFLKGLE